MGSNSNPLPFSLCIYLFLKNFCFLFSSSTLLPYFKIFPLFSSLIIPSFIDLISEKNEIVFFSCTLRLAGKWFPTVKGKMTVY